MTQNNIQKRTRTFKSSLDNRLRKTTTHVPILVNLTPKWRTISTKPRKAYSNQL